MIVPPRLHPGDAVGIIAPSGPVAYAAVEKAIDYLIKKGYNILRGESLYSRYRGYLAGKDEERARDIQKMFADPTIKGIFSARGGYGSSRLLEMLDYETIKKNPKIFVGFSDTTALQLALLHKSKLITYTGMLLQKDVKEGQLFLYSEADFWDMIEKNSPSISYNNLQVLQKGNAQGTLIAGCLSVIVSLLGTPYFPDMQGEILILEDINEDTYKVDRMLTQLKLAGLFRDIHGLVAGTFTTGDNADYTRLFQEIAPFISGPVVCGLPYGHIPRSMVLAIGGRSRIIAEDEGTLELMLGTGKESARND